MIKCLVFLFCCIMPYAAEAGEILNVQDGFQLVKAVKLGRGKAYSVATDASLNAGAGGTQIKNCRRTAPTATILPAVTYANPDMVNTDPENVLPVRITANNAYIII